MNAEEFVKFINERNFSGTKEHQHKYISNYYAHEFGKRQHEELLFVELGVRDGYDLTMFADWFENSEIIGIDINNYQIYVEQRDRSAANGWGNYHKHLGQMKNAEFRQESAYADPTISKFANESIDYLIDDASHDLNDQLMCIKKYYPKIKKGGKIIIEDVGYNSHSETCISRICATGSDLGYDVRVFDLREKTDSDFSTIIELQKRQQNER